MVDEMEEAKRMSNLGAYQWLTTAAKKVGGPKNLVLIIAETGVVVYKGSEIVVKKTVKEIKKKIRIHQLTEMADTKVYSVTAEGISNEGLAFKIGDQFRVLETDKDAVLIEKIDNDNNPYFVSEELLMNISNYKCQEGKYYGTFFVCYKQLAGNSIRR